MTVGIVMLVHTSLERAEQVIRHWVAGRCPVVVHVDKNVDDERHDAFVSRFDGLSNVRFSKRHRCEWGTWGLVAASQDASQLMLETFPEVRHVYLASGSCLPLRPVNELVSYLAKRPRTDFIESATTADVPWTIGGLDEERFTLRFPFSWKRQRYFFDKYVALQRRLGVRLHEKPCRSPRRLCLLVVLGHVLPRAQPRPLLHHRMGGLHDPRPGTEPRPRLCRVARV